MLDEPFKDGEPPKINGSMMIARATSREEVVEELKKDVYTTAGIWDWNNVRYYFESRKCFVVNDE